MNKTLLFINGLDPTGATGIFQDFRVTHNHKLYSCGIVTCLYHQNTQKLISIHQISLEQIAQQLDCVLSDIKIHGIKISGILEPTLAQLLSEVLEEYKNAYKVPIIFDPHFFWRNESDLIPPNKMSSIVNSLEKISNLIIFNLKEAEVIANNQIKDVVSMKSSLEEISKNFKCKNILLTGGDLKDKAIDIYYDGSKSNSFEVSKQPSENLLGLGDALSSFILCSYVKGTEWYQAIPQAKLYVKKTMNHNFPIGKGLHPINLNIPL